MRKSYKPTRVQIAMALKLAFPEMFAHASLKGGAFTMRTTILYCPNVGDVWQPRYDGDPNNRRLIIVTSPQVRGKYMCSVYADNAPVPWFGFEGEADDDESDDDGSRGSWREDFHADG